MKIQNPKSKIQNPLPTAYVLVLALLCCLARFANAHDDHEALPSKGASVQGALVLLSPTSEKAIGLTKTKVTLEPWRQMVTVNATVEAPCTRHGYASAMISGKIEELGAKPGDQVKQGQQLGCIKSLELGMLQARLLQAADQHDLALLFLDQQESLAHQGASAKQKLFTARADYREKTASLRLAKAKLLALGLSKEAIDRVIATRQPVHSLPILSPIAGTLSMADVRVGQTVQPAEHLFHIIDLTSVMLVGEVLESDAWRVHERQPVRVVLASFDDSPLSGRLDHVGLKLDARQRTLLVRADLENPDGRIRQGMFGRMEIEVGNEPEAIVCPAEAVIHRPHGDFVFVERGRGHGKYERRAVRVAQRRGNRAMVEDGIFPGQRVVTVGAFELAALVDQLSEGQPEPAKSGAAKSTMAVVSAKSLSNSSASRIITLGRIELPTGAKHFATSTVEGRLTSILVERGDRVKAGQVLAEIDSLELRNLQLELLAAEAKLELTNQTLKRLEDLLDQKLLTQKEIWQLESDQRSLTSQINCLGEQLALLGLEAAEIERLKKLDLSAEDAGERLTTLLPVRAPADGWVTDFELGIGEVVQPADQLFELQDPSTVWAQAHVYEHDAARVRVGQQVSVTVEAEPGLVAHGKIARISPVVSATGRVLALWAEIDNRDRRLKEGMLAQIEIILDDELPAVARSEETDAP
ncbi:MAG TPA: efflux RND transporter periplasmic adaptor subunit [Pirellulales bacterium]|nr:efflux RND transporter periplasmic adaptor subunit [Pirellulales bacterium]